MNTQTEKLQKIANGEIDHEQAVEILRTAWAEIKKVSSMRGNTGI